MHSMRKTLKIAAGFSVLAVAACATPQYPQGMTFFITSVGTGKGADLGGIEGADRHCQSLAAKVGAGSRTWRAYLSSQGKTTSDTNVVHARDRIGTGPWHNAKGERIARDVADLHSPNNNINKETGLDETGKQVNGRGDKPNKHDILTGSRLDGTAFASQTDMTCGNWTKSGDGSAMVGHHDRSGPVDHPWAVSWNSSHNSIGCSQPALVKTGGAGLLYCYAEK